MTVICKFYDLHFEFNSSVIHIDKMIACNAQHSQENFNRWERELSRDQYMGVHKNHIGEILVNAYFHIILYFPLD